MKTEIEDAMEYAAGLDDVADCYADRCAVALRKEVERLRAELGTSAQEWRSCAESLARDLRGCANLNGSRNFSINTQLSAARRSR
jgi:hypothetical protein